MSVNSRKYGKKIIIMTAVVIAALLCSGFGLHKYKNNNSTEELQMELAEKIIRFHVLADNDSNEAQNLKLLVKDKTIEYMKPLFEGNESIDNAREIINNNLEDIEKNAYKVVKDAGYEYNVSAELTNCYFPIKEYGDLRFPAGEYEALRIKIGRAEGRNWWCVMYPNLCFVDGTYAVVSDTVQKELEQMLTREEYDLLLGGTKTKVSFKLFNLLKDK